jgi:hypothetical protein
MPNHLMHWVTFFLNHHSSIDKFHQRWAMMPPYPGFAQFNKPYCQMPQASHSIPFPEAQLGNKNLIKSQLMPQYM